MEQPSAARETRYYQLAEYNLGVAIAFIVADVLAVALRVWARKRQNVKLQSDDWLIFIALILVIGSASAMITCRDFLPF